MKRYLIFIIFIIFLVSCINSQKVKDNDKRRGTNYPVVTPDGVTFRIEAPEAIFVTIAGQFNGWNPQATVMNKTENGIWEITLDLRRGQRHRYKFLIDGVWVPDPDNPYSEPDGFAGLNSIIYVPKEKTNE